eukprot:5954373-Prymnesium_polylepis.1
MASTSSTVRAPELSASKCLNAAVRDSAVGITFVGVRKLESASKQNFSSENYPVYVLTLFTPTSEHGACEW